jgi:IclR family KDG regulon transcriptional repressor
VSSAGKYTVPAVDRALTVLETLASSRRGISLAELSNQTGIPKSSLFRILFTLEQKQYVEQDHEKKKFDLGLKLFELGHAKIEQIDLSSIATKYLQRVAHEVQESVYLGILDRGEVYLIQRVDSPTVWRMVTRLGHHSPAHCTAIGQVLLADLPEDELKSFLKENSLQKFTEYTIVSVTKLRKRLAEVRKQGYAVVDREYHPELLTIAAPVRNHTDKAVASLMVALPTSKATNTERTSELITRIRKVSLELSRELGYKD